MLLEPRREDLPPNDQQKIEISKGKKLNEEVMKKVALIGTGQSQVR